MFRSKSFNVTNGLSFFFNSFAPATVYTAVIRSRTFFYTIKDKLHRRLEYHVTIFCAYSPCGRSTHRCQSRAADRGRRTVGRPDAPPDNRPPIRPSGQKILHEFRHVGCCRIPGVFFLFFFFVR